MKKKTDYNLASNLAKKMKKLTDSITAAETKRIDILQKENSDVWIQVILHEIKNTARKGIYYRIFNLLKKDLDASYICGILRNIYGFNCCYNNDELMVSWDKQITDPKVIFRIPTMDGMKIENTYP